MGLFDASGNRIAKASFPTTAVAAADTPKIVSQDIYETAPYDNKFDTDPKGGRLLKLKYKSGAVVYQRDIDAQYPAATITSISPATGPIAGGTTVTINGTNLDGATAVTIGVACTSVVVVSPTQMTAVTASTTAGAKDVVVTDDSGTATLTSGYTFA